MTERQTPEQRVRSQLVQAGPAAVRFLIRAMKDEQLPCKERIDIARDLLNRGFGKTLPGTEDTAPAIRVVLADEVKPYAD